jgi:hypothetical protein
MEKKEKKKRFTILNQILKEKGRWSQSRIYLFWSIIAYYLTLGIITFGGLNPNYDLDMNKFKIIIDALEYAMVLFAGYTFGGKFVDAFKEIRIKKDNNQNDYDGSYE